MEALPKQIRTCSAYDLSVLTSRAKKITMLSHRLARRRFPWYHGVRSLLTCRGSGNGLTILNKSSTGSSFSASTSTQQTESRVGIALCGFGRAGQIHFRGIRQNYRCSLKYIVDVAETVTRGSIQEFLERYNLSNMAKVISAEEFENVYSPPPSPSPSPLIISH